MLQIPPPLLAINNVEVIYDHVILVLKGVSLEVRDGTIVALLGRNGAGKTTTLKAISNLLSSERGDVTKGSIEFRGERIDQLTPWELVKARRGAGDGRPALFPAPDRGGKPADRRLHAQRLARRARQDLEKVYQYFPRLKERRKSQAGYTSGGEQQMTAIGRALMAKPSMILLDEPSMGLAPQIVDEIFEIVRETERKGKVSFLLAEQNTMVALRYADYGYILENGRVVMDGPADDLASNEDVKEFYLGMSTAGRKSFRDSSITVAASAGSPEGVAWACVCGLAGCPAALHGPRAAVRLPPPLLTRAGRPAARSRS